jgi:hypothetical protein
MLTTDRVAGGGLTLFALVVLWESRKYPLGSLHNPGPGYMPVLLASLLLLFGLLVLATGGRSEPFSTLRWDEGRHAAAILGTCAFAAVALERLGYRLTVLLALAVLIGIVERRRPLVAVAVSAGVAFGSFYLFNTLLRVLLPLGPFGW